MREIKFRGYSVEELISESQWIEGGFGVHNVKYIDGKDECYLYTEHGVYEVYKESVGQFTGIQDVNGKDVYEGDILEYRSVVTYVDASDPANLGMEVGFYAQRDNFESWRLLEVGEECEVLGNIYENPKLLERN